ncbi:MAG TPA: hypothetical protein VM145_03275 [Sphingomicrobium sp.]|nr:hypothetical protein [Sphingomicrobium sp.]
MASTAQTSTPVTLWIVGILAVLWNAFGCYDYLMTNLHNAAYLAAFPADQLAYFDSLPSWLTAFWALGVWCGLAGGLLLLARSRHAVLAFAVSVLGIVISFGYQMFATEMPASMKQGVGGAMPWVIFIVGLFLLWYARSAEKQGLLR